VRCSWLARGPFIAEQALTNEISAMQVYGLAAYAEVLSHGLRGPAFLEHAQDLFTVDYWFSCHWNPESPNYALPYHAS